MGTPPAIHLSAILGWIRKPLGRCARRIYEMKRVVGSFSSRGFGSRSFLKNGKVCAFQPGKEANYSHPSKSNVIFISA